MEIVKTIIKTATHKGITLKFVFVKCDNGKWYEMRKCIYGFMYKEIKQDEEIKGLEKSLIKEGLK